MSERRQVTRWQIAKQVMVRTEGQEISDRGTVHDLNFKGMQISLPAKIPKDVFIKLSLDLSEDFTLHVEVWVAWHKTIDGHNLYGLYFSKIRDTDKEKIYQFMRRDFSQELAQKCWEGIKKGGEKDVENKKFEDRRVFERFSIRLAVRYLDTAANREGVAYTQDISAKGMGLVTVEKLAVNASLEIWLQMPDKGEPLYTRGEVVWSKSNAENAYQAGINLEKADLMGFSRVIRAL